MQIRSWILVLASASLGACAGHPRQPASTPLPPQQVSPAQLQAPPPPKGESEGPVKFEPGKKYPGPPIYPGKKTGKKPAKPKKEVKPEEEGD